MRERSRERAAPVDGHRARKRFGQHFLVDTGVVRAIVDAIAPRDGQQIVEIGPGLGALTEVLLERVESIQAVELDRDLARRLRGRYPASQLLLHEADALAFDFGLALPDEARAAGQRLRVVGNLPYNISSPLLLRLLGQRAIVDDLHFMLQKEVVDRIVAGPGSADYGRLSVLFFFLVTGVIASYGTYRYGLAGVGIGASGGLMGLIGVAAPKDIEERISGMILSDPDVRDISRLRILQEGRSYHVEAYIELKSGMTLAEAGKSKTRIITRLMTDPDVSDAILGILEDDGIKLWNPNETESVV